MVITNMVHVGMMFTDTVFAGRLSPQDLAGVAVGGSVGGPVFMGVMGVLIAVSPTVSHQFGAGERERIGHTVRQALWLALFLSIPGVALLSQGYVLMRAIGVAPDVIPLAAGYLDGLAWGMPAVAMFYVLRFTSEAVSHTRPLILVALLGLAVNAFADWVLMYGNLGFPRLGAVGTGYATALVQWCTFAALLWYVRWAPVYRPLSLFARFEWPQVKEISALFKLGAPIAVSVFMEGSLFSAVGLMMATLGVTVVAAHQVAINWASIMFMVPLGLAGGITVRVGQALGAGDRDQARFAGITGMVVCTGFMGIAALPMLLFPETIVSLYTGDAAVTAVAAGLLHVAAAFALFDGLQVAAGGVLRGYKDTRIPMFMTVFAYWGLGFPVAWLLGVYLDLGPVWVWVGLIAGLLAAGVMLTLRFARLARA
jgi:multidrug resistance protein, MATE family